MIYKTYDWSMSCFTDQTQTYDWSMSCFTDQTHSFLAMCDVFRYDIVFVCNNSFSLLCISKILYLNIKLASLAAEHKCLDLNQK